MNTTISILLVDDEEKIAIKLSKILSAEGYNVDTAFDGKNAIKKLSGNEYDIVLSDLNMPECNGLEVMKFIKDHDIHALPLVLTGYASVEAAINAIKVGAYDFIQKPVDAETLKLSISRAAERIILKRQNIKQMQELQQLNELKNEYLTIVSHDLRSPLSSIGGYVNYLMKNGDLSDLQQRYLSVIKDIADNLYSLVNELLDISKIETGIIDLNYEKIDLESLIHLCINNFVLLGVDKNTVIEFHNKLSAPHIYIDKMKIIQVFNNLINNAIKFTENGKVVIIAGEKNKNTISISIKDNGVGIDPDEIENLFNPFYLNHKKGTRGETGNGLGLVICKRFIELHGGQIDVSSKVGKGTMFSLTLPRNKNNGKTQK
jgi:two-component system, sensor histidine kinase and response regulator